MADVRSVREGMQVLGSDGGMVGAVAAVHGDHLHVRATPPIEGVEAHLVPSSWIARVDQHVHLDREAALVRDTWRPADHVVTGAHVHEPAHSGVGKSWIVWLIGLILLALIIVLGIRGCGYAASDTNTEQPAVDAPGA